MRVERNLAAALGIMMMVLSLNGCYIMKQQADILHFFLTSCKLLGIKENVKCFALLLGFLVLMVVMVCLKGNI